MIAVLGRPCLAGPLDDTPGADAPRLAGLAARVSMAAASAGADVELIGSLGDDPEGDAAIIALARAGVGHAALLRDPAGRTPLADRTVAPLPRLDADDTTLGLGYLVDYGVLVIAEVLSEDAQAAALEAASYHGAAVVAVVPAGTAAPSPLAEAATVLEAPADEGTAFIEMVGRYVAALDGGAAPADALATAARDAGWERAAVEP